MAVIGGGNRADRVPALVHPSRPDHAMRRANQSRRNLRSASPDRSPLAQRQERAAVDCVSRDVSGY
jgi:hypothetical protein